jgi:K+-sensing histidine kinase KdpD
MINLIHFAREHTLENQEIEIHSLFSDGVVECQVTDGGHNYNDALTDLLSEQFSANNNGLNLSLGIGLAVSQMIMEAHGGYLLFEKSPEGKGRMKMVMPHE